MTKPIPLKEGEYCPECNMRTARGQISHLPKCTLKPIFKQAVNEKGNVLSGLQEGSRNHQVYEKLKQRRKILVKDMISELCPPLDSKGVRDCLTQLRTMNLVLTDGHGAWEIIDAKDDIRVRQSKTK